MSYICTGPPETHLHYYPRSQAGNTSIVHEGRQGVLLPPDTFQAVRCIGSGRSKQILRFEEFQLLECEDVGRKGREGGDRAWGSTATSCGDISEKWGSWNSKAEASNEGGEEAEAYAHGHRGDREAQPGALFPGGLQKNGNLHVTLYIYSIWCLALFLQVVTLRLIHCASLVLPLIQVPGYHSCGHGGLGGLCQASPTLLVISQSLFLRWWHTVHLLIEIYIWLWSMYGGLRTSPHCSPVLCSFSFARFTEASPPWSTSEYCCATGLVEVAGVKDEGQLVLASDFFLGILLITFEHIEGGLRKLKGNRERGAEAARTGTCIMHVIEDATTLRGGGGTLGEQTLKPSRHEVLLLRIGIGRNLAGGRRELITSSGVLAEMSGGIVLRSWEDNFWGN
ncbi:hypothetical protein B0H11DRAFT_2435647 [Mycena galericulata]|nr:hypothetical protein B0H11DRAFT_2435647 [Mycena galericulata]